MTIPSTLITLILVMDPFGNLPIFAAIFNHIDEEKRLKIFVRESIIALLILVVFLFFGQILLDSLHLSQASMSVTGGIILFIIAIRMIFPTKDEHDNIYGNDPFIVPIAMPMIAGPSTLALVMLMGTQGATEIHYPLLALIIAWCVNTIILALGLYFSKHLGKHLLIALERLMGMLLTTLAVEMFLHGVADFYHIHLLQ